MKNVTQIFFLFLLTITQIHCQDNYHSVNNKYDFSKVRSIINNAIEDSAFPGAVVLIGKNDTILFEEGFGHYTYDVNSAEVTKRTIYDLASLTKVIATTTACMLCIDRKILNLDDNISKYIPAFNSEEKKSIKIKNLLLHNSGLPAWKKYYDKDLTRDEILNDIYNSKLEYPTGTKTIYSDLGMIILGKIIEKVTGKTLDKFCNEEIFKPLGMKNTFFNPPDSLKNKIAPTELDNYWRNRLIQGEVHDENASLLGGAAGHAGLFSTAGDIAKLIQMILNKGKIVNKHFISEETIKLFTTKPSTENLRVLGWDLKSPEGSSAGNKFSNQSFGHLGFTGTSVWVDPTRNLFVVFLTNRVYPSRENKKIFKVRPALHDAVIESVE